MDKVQEAGDYTVIWDGGDNAGHEVSRRVYFYRMTAEANTHTRPQSE